MNKYIVLLLVILLVAAILRFYRLDTLPPSFEWDEVATGYDAYSILKTGKDQYGTFLPLTMRSLDDYKPPLYTYLTVLSIAIWGWTDFAIRFPAAFLGVLAVGTSYMMTYELLKRRDVALLSAAFLAVSPWHVNFSRLALETNSTIFFTTAGVWAFYKGLQNGKYLLLSALLLGLNLYLYHNTRVFIPILGVGLLALHWKQLLLHKKYMTIATVLVVLFVLRLIPIVTSVEGTMRFQGTSIFSPAVSLEQYRQKQQFTLWRQNDREKGEGILAKLYHSDAMFYGLKIIRNYLSHFDPTFWMFTSDSPRHFVSPLGLMYLIDLPLIYIGMFFLLREKNRKTIVLLILWMLATPIPASVTRDAPHSLRTAIFLPTFQILIALGILGLIKKIHHTHLRRLFISGTIVIYLYFVVFFVHQYFEHYAALTSELWLYGRREAALYADAHKSGYDKVLVSTRLDQPHMFFLYYLKYDPAKYLREGGTLSGGWAEDRNHFDKYYFMSIDYDKMKDGKTLFVGLPNEFPKDTVPMQKIQYLNSKDAIWIVE